MRVAVTGARGALGQALMPLLGPEAVPIDRLDGIAIEDGPALMSALRGCDAIVHLAALHPLVAPPDADTERYRRANVTPFVGLLAAARQLGVQRLLLASSTSVWNDAKVRLVDESTEPDATDPYASSKRACEGLLVASGLQGVRLRFARFARQGDAADEVRKLYRAVDVRDAAAAVVSALERAPRGSVYAISAPTPFEEWDMDLLASDPRAAIVHRTGKEPAWIPQHVGVVVRSLRAMRDLGWRCAYPSSLLPA
jgi:nucleoside-diphosphate-sugar epimerase